MQELHNLPSIEQMGLLLLLFEERNLTRAARKLGLSQPATSRLLAKLRDCFDDPLFVKTRAGMQPTPRAEALLPSVRQLLDGCAQLLEPQAFAPAELKRVFTIGTGDFGELGFLPKLIAKLEELAPHVDVVTRPLPVNLHAALASGELDLSVGVFDDMSQDLMRQHLFDDHFVCAVRSDHPELGSRITLQKFTALRHVLIAPYGEPGGAVDIALSALNLSRRVQVRLSSFIAAPLLVSQTNLVMTGPKQILEPLGKMLPLRLFAPPVELPGFSVYQVWHSRFQTDPAHAWFRGLIAQLSESTPDVPAVKPTPKKSRTKRKPHVRREEWRRS
jgi:DNA-binding transcriptional LysR family regulator